MPGNPLYRTQAWRTLARTRINIGRANHEPCCRCHGRLGPIRYDQPGTRRLGPTADHLDPLAHGGTHLPPLTELGVAHRTCNSRHGAHIGNLLQGIGPGSRGGNPATYTGKHRTRSGPAKPRKPADPTQGPTQPTPGLLDPTTAFLPAHHPHPEPTRRAALPQSSTDSAAPDPEFGPDAAMFAGIPWLSSLFPLPPEAVWPRLMTAPHPAAVGSYGVAAIERIEARRAADPRVPARAKRLRWFQKLVLLRQWEHDADGQLCWAAMLATMRRQVGKSVLLSERSMERTASFAEIAGEPQLVMQVSKDLSAAREVQRLIRLWALDQEEAAKAAARDEKGKLPPGYKPSYVVRGTHGQEEIELPDSSRYMIRGRDSVYSYSVSEAELDEAWGVRPEIVFDGLEPTMAERELSQLCLTSTAHPKTTALVPGQRAQAIGDLWAPSVDSMLLIEWSAHSSWDLHDPRSWRAASPHWDARQERVVSRAHSRWVRGEEDDETRAAGGFPFQYLNMWPAPKAVARWLAAEVWAGGSREGLVVPRDRAVLGVSLDSGSGRWPVVVAAQVEGGIAVAWVGEFGSLEEALAAAAERKGSACSLLAPRGLRGHAVLRGVRESPLVHEGDVTAAQDMCAAWLAAGRLLHDAGDAQVSAAVLARPRRRESGRFDAGTLALLCAWWAGREAPRSVVV